MLRQRRLIPPARGHHPHRPPAPGPHQESQEIQRLTVRPVHVLHDQPHPGRRPASHRGQQLRHPGEQPLPAPLPVPASRARPGVLAHPGQQPPHFFPHISGGGVQRRRQQPAALPPAQFTQRVRNREQRQRARQWQALPPHHHHPRGRGPVHRLGHEPGFARARIPHHQHQPHIAGQRLQQPGQFTLPADKTHWACHAHSPPVRTRTVNPPGRRAVADWAGGQACGRWIYAEFALTDPATRRSPPAPRPRGTAPLWPPHGTGCTRG